MKKQCLALLSLSLLLLSTALPSWGKTTPQEEQQIFNWSYLSSHILTAHVLHFMYSFCETKYDCSEDLRQVNHMEALVPQEIFTQRFMRELMGEGEGTEQLALDPSTLKQLGQQRQQLKGTLRELKSQLQQQLPAEQLALLQQEMQTAYEQRRYRVQESSVKANMHSLQTMIETYGVDWGGTYPENLHILVKEAQQNSNPYWKELTNPFTQQTGIGQQGAMLDFANYRAGNPLNQGLVIYESSPSKSLYFIYGVDAQGNWVQDQSRNEAFYLSNS